MSTNPSPKLALTWAEGKVLNSRGLRAWVHSLRAVSDCDIVVCSPVPINVTGARNVVVKPFGGRPLHRRWSAYSDAIRQSGSELVMVSDSRDLIFQDDPFTVFQRSEARDQRPEIIVAGEHQRCEQHPWCADKERDLCKRIGIEPDLSREEINGGIQLGTRDAILMLSVAMELGMYCGVDTDQALLNWWFYKRCPVPWTFAPPNWYLHGESVKAGRLKMELKNGLAYLQNGSVAPQPATVWHQYDRTGHTAVCHNKFRPAMKELGVLVVVNHFNEDLKWLDTIDQESFVISKSEIRDQRSEISRPNVGFEAESWAWFFATYYDELPDVVVCLQGNPFAHCTRELFNETIAKAVDCSHGPMARLNAPQGRGYSFSYSPLSSPGHSAWTWIDDVTHHPGLPLREWWNRLFSFPPVRLGPPPPLRFHAIYGGQFAVHRDAIRARPRQYWQMIAANCKTREDACSLERLWQFIFL